MKNKLEFLRKQKKVNQDEFAKLMKVSRQTISYIENDKYNPSLELAFRISKYFNMQIEEIFIFEEVI